MSNEIVLYQSNELPERIEVRVEEDTVWLNRQQLSLLFGRDVKTIGKHINNVFVEGELSKNSTVAKFATVQIETFDKSHDRFLIIDASEVYHLGASLKDLGKKWFAFSKLDKNSVENILKAITDE